MLLYTFYYLWITFAVCLLTRAYAIWYTGYRLGYIKQSQAVSSFTTYYKQDKARAKTMTIQKYWTINIFDSHNTSFSNYDTRADYFAVKTRCVNASKMYHHIILENNNGWEQFENGKITEWSYPNGCGQIKINQ